MVKNQYTRIIQSLFKNLFYNPILEINFSYTTTKKNLQRISQPNLCLLPHIPKSSSKTIFISGLSAAGRVHFRATWSIPSRFFAIPSSLKICESKHSTARFSTAMKLTHSARSTTSGLPGMMSEELLPVRSSRRITPKAYTSLFIEGQGFVVLVNSGGR